jgi:hypothetical protein
MRCIIYGAILPRYIHVKTDLLFVVVNVCILILIEYNDFLKLKCQHQLTRAYCTAKGGKKYKKKFLGS